MSAKMDPLNVFEAFKKAFYNEKEFRERLESILIQKGIKSSEFENTIEFLLAFHQIETLLQGSPLEEGKERRSVQLTQILPLLSPVIEKLNAIKPPPEQKQAITDELNKLMTAIQERKADIKTERDLGNVEVEGRRVSFIFTKDPLSLTPLIENLRGAQKSLEQRLHQMAVAKQDEEVEADAAVDETPAKQPLSVHEEAYARASETKTEMHSFLPDIDELVKEGVSRIRTSEAAQMADADHVNDKVHNGKTLLKLTEERLDRKTHFDEDLRIINDLLHHGAYYDELDKNSKFEEIRAIRGHCQKVFEMAEKRVFSPVEAKMLSEKMDSKKAGEKEPNLINFINARRAKDGNTPLHLAIKSNNVGLIRFLRENGAEFDLKNNEGKTAKDLFLLKDKLKDELPDLEWDYTPTPKETKEPDSAKTRTPSTELSTPTTSDSEPSSANADLSTPTTPRTPSSKKK